MAETPTPMAVDGAIKDAGAAPPKLSISTAIFDHDDGGADSGSSRNLFAAERSVCYNCTPQAARWSCSATKIEAFDVTWRRVDPATKAKGVVVHSERVHVFAKKGVATAECFSSYMPSLDDVGYLLQVDYTPIPKTVKSEGAEPPSPSPPIFSRTHTATTKFSVQANEQTTLQVGDAIRRGVAEFVVVCEADQWSGGDLYCELSINKLGIKARRMGGIQALLGLVTGDGKRELPFCEDIDVTTVASVTLPSELLQVTLRGHDGTELHVQAESPNMRDAIVGAARRFAAIAKRGTPKNR